MFTIPCFIRKNTKELQEYLSELGYKMISPTEHSVLECNNGWVNDCNDDAIGIDCGTSEDLFKAISALRDDSDIYQWFTDGVNWEYCIEDKFSTHDINQNNGMSDLNLITRHKATIDELIKQFG